MFHIITELIRTCNWGHKATARDQHVNVRRLMGFRQFEAIFRATTFKFSVPKVKTFKNSCSVSLLNQSERVLGTKSDSTCTWTAHELIWRAVDCHTPCHQNGRGQPGEWPKFGCWEEREGSRVHFQTEWKKLIRTPSRSVCQYEGPDWQF